MRPVGGAAGLLACAVFLMCACTAAPGGIEGYWTTLASGTVIKIERLKEGSYRGFVVRNGTAGCPQPPGHLVATFSGTGNPYQARVEWRERQSCQLRFSDSGTFTLTSAGSGEACSVSPFPGETQPNQCLAFTRLSAEDCSSLAGCEQTTSYAILAAVTGGVIAGALITPGLLVPGGGGGSPPDAPAAAHGNAPGTRPRSDPDQVAERQSAVPGAGHPGPEGRSLELEMAGLEMAEEETEIESTVSAIAGAEGAIAARAGQDETLTAARACNRFGLQLLNQLLTGVPVNVCVSPLAAAIGLGLIMDASRGDARSAAASALGLPEDRLGENLANLRAMSTADAGNPVALATGLWVRAGIAPRPGFVDLARERYGAAVMSIDFSSRSARDELDGWVSAATDGKIQHLAAPFSEASGLVLVSACHLRSAWEDASDPRLARGQKFMTTSGEKQVPFVRREGLLAYMKSDRFELARLSQSGGPNRILLLLPSDVLSPVGLRALVAPGLWKELSASQDVRRGSISMPRMELGQEVSLDDPLRELGLVAALRPLADFSPLSEQCAERCHLSAVTQSSRLEIDAAGTTPAASAAPHTEVEFEMVVDRPFVLGIEDVSGGVMLFLAAVSDPMPAP